MSTSSSTPDPYNLAARLYRCSASAYDRSDDPGLTGTQHKTWMDVADGLRRAGNAAEQGDDELVDAALEDVGNILDAAISERAS